MKAGTYEDASKSKLTVMKEDIWLSKQVASDTHLRLHPHSNDAHRTHHADRPRRSVHRQRVYNVESFLMPNVGNVTASDPR